ncbi:hypothetical protein AB1Y20_015504 [Prymnesium parvum]|uniref:PiggyBac transposable element-derived protein domain-containing protein n=1 Tax=Prymnesium parvum TaxID=97485 RepID=A0AB34K144_PRYPA
MRASGSNRGRGRGRGRARGARTLGDSSDSECSLAGGQSPHATDATACEVDPKMHPIGIVILSHNPPKGIRFTMSKEFFKAASNYHELPERIVGEIDRWIDKENNYRLKILWISDQTNTIQTLGSILDPEYRIALEAYEDGRSAPKAKGTSWRRMYAAAKSAGPYADAILEDARSEVEATTIQYTEGTHQLDQVWRHHPPGFVTEDWRTGGERPRMKVQGLTANQFNEFEKFLFNACLPMSLARKCVQWINDRIPGNGAESSCDLKRRTTLGEVVKFWGYLGSIALQPGTPVDRMWRRHPQVGDISPAPDMGRHGMHKNRFKKLRSLHRFFYYKDERDLNPMDPYRY